MKDKTVKYDDIITYFDEVPYNHGTIEYENYTNRNGINLLTSKINVMLAILPENREDFLKELTCLIEKYAQ